MKPAVNPYAFAPDWKIYLLGSFWRAVRPDGSIAGLFPCGHFKTPTDVTNALRLMAKAYQHGFEDRAGNEKAGGADNDKAGS